MEFEKRIVNLIFPNIDFISDLKAFAIQQLRHHKIDFDESATAQKKQAHTKKTFF